MQQIKELEKLFLEINKLKSKAKTNTSQFCSKLTESDDDKFLELHFYFLQQKKRYFQSSLKMYFGFRQDKLKTHTFLKHKLSETIDEVLKQDIEEILADINYLTLDEVKKWVLDIKTGERTDSDEFVWFIVKSPYMEYHYELLLDTNLNKALKDDLRYRFSDYKEAGELFLWNKLKNNEDTNFHADIIFILGKIATVYKKEILQYARKLTSSIDDYTRDRAIIVLGWIGGVQEYAILKNQLLHDTNANCRAWSASSFMQMWLKRKSEKLRLFARSSFKEALEKENDNFVLSVIIDSIRTIENNKFGISQSSIDNINVEALRQATERIKRYIDKKI